MNGQATMPNGSSRNIYTGVEKWNQRRTSVFLEDIWPFRSLLGIGDVPHVRSRLDYIGLKYKLRHRSKQCQKTVTDDVHRWGQILRERRGEVRTETQCSPSKLVVEPPGQCLTEYIVTGSAWGNSGTYPLRSGALRWFWFHTPKEQGLGECSS